MDDMQKLSNHLLCRLKMSNLFFDETIRDRGEFIISALLVWQTDLSPVISELGAAWAYTQIQVCTKVQTPKGIALLGSNNAVL
jgi:hypothetical protein